jgi:hypothetical protein
MKPTFQTTSKRARATFAIAAVFVSLLIGSGIEGLVDHYQGQTKLAGQPTVTLAQR